MRFVRGPRRVRVPLAWGTRRSTAARRWAARLAPRRTRRRAKSLFVVVNPGKAPSRRPAPPLLRPPLASSRSSSTASTAASSARCGASATASRSTSRTSTSPRPPRFDDDGRIVARGGADDDEGDGDGAAAKPNPSERRRGCRPSASSPDAWRARERGGNTRSLKPNY